MWLVLLAWITGSAIFIAGWVLGAIMERRHGASAGGGGGCPACRRRTIDAGLAREPLVPSASALN
jgi:hypothetical protein